MSKPSAPWTSRVGTLQDSLRISPFRECLGGAFRDSIAAYATGCYYRGEDYLHDDNQWAALGKEAESYVSGGFRILKMKVGLLNVSQDLARVEAATASDRTGVRPAGRRESCV